MSNEQIQVVFLDVDGVLNNHATPATVGEYLRDPHGGPVPLRMPIDPVCADNLNGLLLATGARVVISSSWRLFAGHAELARAMAEHGIIADVIDQTPDAANDQEFLARHRSLRFHDMVERGHEIEDWLARNIDRVSGFVILDDCSDMGRLRSCLVHTDATRGLTRADARWAMDVLSETSPRVLRVLREGLP